jgi:hypothetical protein
MADDFMEYWLINVWKRRPGALRRPPNILVLVACHGHLSEEVKVKLELKNCVLVVVLDCMTSQFQLLDVSVNEAFIGY